MKNESKRIIDKKNDDYMNGSYLGPRYSSSEIETTLNSLNASYKKLNEKQIIDYAANEMSKGKIIGWMQGRCEFGPRALGNRSILADPRNINMQRNLNLKIKYRKVLGLSPRVFLKIRRKNGLSLKIKVRICFL